MCNIYFDSDKLILLCNFKTAHTETHVCVYYIPVSVHAKYIGWVKPAPCDSVPLSALWWLSLAITEYACTFKIDLYASWCNGIMKPKLDLLDVFFNLSVW